MTLDAGTRLGSLEIVSMLGKGGMGEVYRARDTRLDRQVAAKVLPSELADDPERLARFEREAKALAALNHPSIATIHGFFKAAPLTSEADSANVEGAQEAVLVMELVEGPTLAERIFAGPVAPDEAIPMFLQIAAGLEAAHAKGIVHRDLKPANIKLGSDDVSGASRVKILDFGLAKALGDSAAGDESRATDLTHSPTLTLAATMRGEILGTAAYMAPEQARGDAVDHRADIWAFGVCLWEALTGARLYQADSAPDILAKVLEREPDWDALPDGLPPALLRLLRRCLVKSAAGRLQHIGDARLELLEALEPVAEVDSQGAPDPAAGRWRKAALLAGVAAVVAISALVANLVRDPPGAVAGTERVERFEVSMPTGAELRGQRFALSPDGKLVAFLLRTSEGDQLWLRDLASLTATPLPGTKNSTSPFFSADGQWLAFYAEAELRKISLRGGSPIHIADFPNVADGGAWSADGTIFVAPEGISTVNANGGDLKALTTVLPDETNHDDPALLPGHRRVLFTARKRSGQTFVRVIDRDSGEVTTVTDGFNGRYSRTGHLLFMRGTTLWAAPFDLDSLRLTREPQPLDAEIRMTQPLGYSAVLAPGVDGELFYAADTQQTSEVVSVDRSGRATPVLAELAEYRRIRPSPDGSRLAFETAETKRGIWVHDLERDSRLPIATEFQDPVWSPDGKTLYLSDLIDLHGIPSDGSGELEVLVERDHIQSPHAVSPDGRWLSFYDIHPISARDIWMLPLDGPPEPVPFVVTAANEASAIFSPDGRWVAYVSDQSGRREVWVADFPAASRRRMVSYEGGSEPIWSKSGDEIFFRRGSEVWAVGVSFDPDPVIGAPEMLFDGPYHFEAEPSGSMNWGLGADGSFYMTRYTAAAAPERLIVVRNWHLELE